MQENLKSRKTNLKIGSVLIIVFVLVYVPSLFHWVYGLNISTGILRDEKLEVAINTDGYLVRDEETFKSPFDGTYIPEIGEGEKIPANYNIATVLKKSSEELLKQLKKVNLDIIRAQKERKGNAALFSDDITKLDNDISKKLNQVIQSGNMNNLDDERELHDSIDALIQKKAEIIGNSGSSDKYINSLKEQEMDLQSRIKTNTKEVYSNQSGIVSFYIDGYEDKLTPEAIKSMTPDFLDSLSITDGMNSLNNKNIGSQIPFVKVIKSFGYNIVFKLDKAKVQNFMAGDNIKVRINEINKVLNGKIDFISGDFGGEFIVSIKLDRCISEVAGLRKTNIDLIIKQYDGLRVPVSALKDIDYSRKIAKIVIVNANYATIKEVAIVGYDSEFAIIDNIEGKDKKGIELYDMYVTKPGNIEEGQIINK